MTGTIAVSYIAKANESAIRKFLLMRGIVSKSTESRLDLDKRDKFQKKKQFKLLKLQSHSPTVPQDFYLFVNESPVETRPGDGHTRFSSTLQF